MVKIKNVVMDRDLGMFFDPQHFASNPNTLQWEPYIGGLQLKAGDEIYISDEHYEQQKIRIDEFVAAKILHMTKIRSEVEVINVDPEIIPTKEIVEDSPSNFPEELEKTITTMKPKAVELEPEIEVVLEAPKEKNSNKIKGKK